MLRVYHWLTCLYVQGCDLRLLIKAAALLSKPHCGAGNAPISARVLSVWAWAYALQVGGKKVMVRCFMTDEMIRDFLRDEVRLKAGSRVLIASEEGLEKFFLTCANYTCMHKRDFWTPSTSKIRHANSTLVQAYVDYLIAGHAEAFYGNRFSSFSQELVDEFKDKGKPAQYINIILRHV